MRTIAVFATYFGTRHGGINVFNLGLLEQLCEQPNTEVICIVPTSNCVDDSISNIACKIIPLRPDGISEFNGTADVDLAAKHLGQYAKSLTVIGHDVKTGLISNACGKILNAKKIIFCHMAYGRYYPLLSSSDEAGKKESEQRNVFGSADHIFAVGPKLRQYVEDVTRLSRSAPPVSQFTPALLKIEPATMRNSPAIIFIGRIEAKNDVVKQAKLAIQAMGRALEKPDPRLNDAKVQIIGAQNADDDSMVRELLNKEAGKPIPSLYKKYIEQRDVSLDHIRDSSLLVMPSIHEGFGLVAWEAMCQAIPLIVSQNSGFYQLMKDLGVADLVSAIHVEGHPTEGANERDIDNLAFLIREKLLHPRESYLQARELLEKVSKHPSLIQEFEQFLLIVGVEPALGGQQKNLSNKPATTAGPPITVLQFSHRITQNEFGQNVSQRELLSSPDRVKTALLNRRITGREIEIDFNSEYLDKLREMAADTQDNSDLAQQAALSLLSDEKIIMEEFEAIKKVINCIGEPEFIHYAFSMQSDLENRMQAVFAFLECLNWLMTRSGRKFDAILNLEKRHFSFWLSEEECKALPFKTADFSLYDGYVLNDFLATVYAKVIGQYCLWEYRHIRNTGSMPRKLGDPAAWEVGPG